ncbi:MAG: hypothetical protein ACPGCN_13735 [bacterium]
MTLMVLLSCLVALIFLAVVAWALIQINAQLAAIGGTPESFLAKLRLGLRAIEKQTSHLPPMLEQTNSVLVSIKGGLPVLAENLTPKSTTGAQND